MFIGNVVKATEEVIYNTSTVCNSLLIINFSLYRNMVYCVHICFPNLLKELIMCKVCPFQATDIWKNSGPKEIANKAISIYFYEVLIRNKSLNHQGLGQFLKCILLLFFQLEHVSCCQSEVEPAFATQPIACLLWLEFAVSFYLLHFLSWDKENTASFWWWLFFWN